MTDRDVHEHESYHFHNHYAVYNCTYEYWVQHGADMEPIAFVTCFKSAVKAIRRRNKSRFIFSIAIRFVDGAYFLPDTDTIQIPAFLLTPGKLARIS